MDVHDPHHLATNDSDDELGLTTENLRPIHAIHTDTPLNCDTISDDNFNLLISALQSEQITDANCAFGNFTPSQTQELGNLAPIACS
jgi:hypothetical protein